MKRLTLTLSIIFLLAVTDLAQQNQEKMNRISNR